MKTRLFPAVLVLVLTATVCMADARLVAVGDVHGAFDDFVRILQKASLLDGAKNWTDGEATLIQTGDILDRGPGGRATMDLLIQLQQQAARKGGRVIVLLGNHEMMNLVGDLRYVTAEDYANYANDQSEKKREAAYQEYVQFKRARAKALNQAPPPETEDSKAQWFGSHPAGFFEHRQAFSPDGTYGKLLRACNAIAVIQETIFLHGGIDPAIAKLTVEQLNRRVKEEIKLFDSYKVKLVEQKVILPFFTFEEMTVAVKEELQFQQKNGKKDLKLLQEFLEMPGWLTMNADGPLWFRGYAEWPDEQGATQVADLLKNYGVRQIVVGHTVQKQGRIQPRFQNRVFLIDTGMLRTYVPNGQASALELQNGAFTGIYEDKEVPITSLHDEVHH